MTKRCLVIGASGDIGAAVASKLVEQGYQVGLHYFSNESSIASIQNGIPASNRLNPVQGDLSSRDGLDRFLKSLDNDWDALVFSGGHAWNGLFQEMSLEEMDQLYHVHVKALWAITRHILPSMIQKKKGNIVVVSSIFGEEGASTEVAYSSVKGAQNSFVKGLAKEVGPSGIRVNAVAPGLIRTKMNQSLTGEDWQVLEDDIPVGRAGTSEEVAEAVSFLLSPKSSYITGHILKVNGGWA
ncbi:SDR family oxidoreductase [Halobacillus fulvus]|nr:SDR family oxidoreductase [Halobacillus fulvus]